MYLCGTMKLLHASASRPSMSVSISARSFSSRVSNSSCDVPRNAIAPRVDVLVHARTPSGIGAVPPVRAVSKAGK